MLMKTAVKGLVVFLGLVVCLGHVLSSSRAAVAEGSGGASAAAPSSAAGAQAKTLFEQRCARCHGADGRGQTVIGQMVEAPDFTDSSWWTREMTDARLRRSIAEGKGQMPSFKKRLSKQEIAALAAYVRRFNK